MDKAEKFELAKNTTEENVAPWIKMRVEKDRNSVSEMGMNLKYRKKKCVEIEIHKSSPKREITENPVFEDNGKPVVCVYLFS